jgi:hypothetical protein
MNQPQVLAESHIRRSERWTYYGDEQAAAGMTEEEMGSMMEAWFKYDHDVRQAVKVISGNALQPTATATTVRVKNGQTVTSDGPFAETKEQLGGYYLIDADNLDVAIEWATKMANLPRR